MFMLIMILNDAVFRFEKGLNGQNHSSSGFHHPVTNFPFQQNIWFACPSGGILTSHPLALFGKLWHIRWSLLVHWYQQWVTVHHLPKCMSCHKAILVINRMAHCFHEYTKNVLKQKIKLEAHFVKNIYIVLLYIDFIIIIIIIYIIDLFSLSP